MMLSFHLWHFVPFAIHYLNLDVFASRSLLETHSMPIFIECRANRINCVYIFMQLIVNNKAMIAKAKTNNFPARAQRGREEDRERYFSWFLSFVAISFICVIIRATMFVYTLYLCMCARVAADIFLSLSLSLSYRFFQPDFFFRSFSSE